MRDRDLTRLSSITGKDLSYHGCSGMSDTELLCGRPYGGVAILWLPHVDVTVVPYPAICNRCCAVKVVTGDVSFAIINVYMPVDNFSSNIIDVELRDTVDNIETFIHSINVDFIVIAGDLNVDLGRSNAHGRFLVDFLSRVDMYLCTSFVPYNFSFTRSCNGSFSLIDHVAVSSALKTYCSKY